MAGVFVRLKVALLRSGFRSSRSFAVLYLLAGLAALGLGILAGVSLAALLGSGPGKGEVLVLALFPIIWATWTFAPLLSGSSGDQTVDPSRLELLPLSYSTQVGGLFLVGLLGPAALGTLIGALGPAASAGTSVGARVALVVVAIVFVLLCVASSRALAASLAGAFDSRRGKEFVVVVSSVVAIAMYFTSRFASSATTELIDVQLTGWWNAVAILPPGALGRAVSAFRDGEWLFGLGLLAWGIVGIVAALAVWRRALVHRLSGGGGSSARAGALAGPVGASVLYPAYAGWLPRSAVGAATAKELRYFLFRSTLQLQQLVLGTLFALLIAWQTIAGDSRSPMAELAGAFVLFFVLFQSAPNLFGIDNAAVTGYLLTGVDMARVLLGKLLALLLIGLPLGVVVQLVEAQLDGTWGNLPIGLAALPIPWLVWLGLGSVLSTWAAFPVIAGKRQSSGRAFAAVFGGLALAVVVLGLVGAAAFGAVALVGSPWAGVATGWVLGLVIGIAGLRLASQKLRRDPTSLLEKLGGDRV